MKLTWSEEAHSCGDAEIDRQHRWLFERINNLLEACSENRLNLEADELFDFLHLYFAEHFSLEEELMVRTQCPLAARNEAEHRTFMQKFEVLKNRFQENEKSPQLLDELQGLLVDWFEGHVKGVDLKLRESLHRS